MKHALGKLNPSAALELRTQYPSKRLVGTDHESLTFSTDPTSAAVFRAVLAILAILAGIARCAPGTGREVGTSRQVQRECERARKRHKSCQIFHKITPGNCPKRS